MTRTDDAHARPATRPPAPRVDGPIILRVERNGPEYVVRPCSGKHRSMVLAGYLVLSCPKCRPVRLNEDDAATDGADQ